MKNNKGILGIVVAMWAAAGLVLAACVWHIPAWAAAKSAHCEALYQAGNMGCGYSK